jgi:nucleotide-binding universal stress UspA family protein
LASGLQSPEAPQQLATLDLTDGAPSGELTVFRTILVPLDGSRLAEQALPLALPLARRAGSALRLALVHRPDSGGPQADVAAFRAQQAYLEQTAHRIRQLGVPLVTTEVIEDGPIAPALCAYADAVGADLVVLTTHGRGPLSRFWLGSVTDELLRTAPLPLLVCRPTDDGPPDPGAGRRFRRILVPLDGTEAAEAALAPAAALARQFGAGLLLFRVVVPAPVLVQNWVASAVSAMEGPILEELTAQARADLLRAARRFRAEGLTVEVRVAVNVSPAAAVLEAAPVADLIALATHGRSGAARLFLGSVADKVVRGAPCPVLVVRSPAPADGPPRTPSAPTSPDR